MKFEATNFLSDLNVQIKEEIKKSKQKAKEQTKKTVINQPSIFDLFSKHSIEKDKVENSKEIKEISQSNIFNLFNNIKSEEMKSQKPKEKESIVVKIKNYIITTFDMIGIGGLKQKCKNNIDAIKTLKKVESEKRNATDAEQKVLVKYVGWGGLAQQVFKEEIDDDWKALAAEVREILTDEEYESAKGSSLNAHYTAINIVKFMWDVIIRLGFSKGRVLEPSLGSGNFFGTMPQELNNTTKLFGIELDNITGRIAKLLYPQAHIEISGFEKVNIKDNSQDVAITNVPYGNYKVFDSRYSSLNFSIHNYFFAKSLDCIHEGGLIAFITSRYTMDSKEEKVRKYISEKANLIAAVRLPNDAFKQNANTEVVTDIIFLQKKCDNSVNGFDWIKVKENKEGIICNEYYVKHPENVLGTMKYVKNGMYGIDEVDVLPDGRNLDECFKNILSKLPQNIFVENKDNTSLFNENELKIANDYPNIKENAYCIIDDKLYQKQKMYLIPVVAKEIEKDRIKGMIEIKNDLYNVIYAQTTYKEDGPTIEAQQNLSNVYDRYTLIYGNINSRENTKAFYDDPDYYTIAALENINEDGLIAKADIFTKRTMQPAIKITHCNTPEEALSVCYNEKLELDMDYISSLLTNIDKQTIAEQLVRKGLILLNPETNEYEDADEYLSGPVVNKLNIAEEYAKKDIKFIINVNYLKDVQPKYLTGADISIRLGSTWIPTNYIKQFVVELLDINDSKDNFNVIYTSYNSSWIIDKGSAYIPYAYNTSTYGTSRMSALKIIEKTLNLGDAEVYDEIEVDSKQKRVKNLKETILAMQKQSEIKEKFKNWIWKDDNRRNTLEKIYNDKFNSTVLRKFHSNIEAYVGMNSNIQLRQHQKDAVSRIVLDKNNVLLDHAVGTGKTYTMVTAAMELKRMGIKKKIMIVVPNSLVESGQWGREFKNLYPAAKILVAISKDFEKSNRKKLISKIATGDWDAVIIGHSSFELIPVSHDTKVEFIENQIQEIKQAIEIAEANSKDKRTVKELEKIQKKLNYKFEELTNMPKDNGLTFENLGVDMIMLDEAHNFKNLFLYTQMRGIAGIPQVSAQKTEDLYMKLQHLYKTYNNKCAVFATGTPISNTLSELYTMQRYLMPQRLEELGLNNFDAWAANFGEVVTSLEVSPTGKGYRTKQRFARFNNVPELMQLFREVADIITDDMVNLPKPALENDKYTITRVNACNEINKYVDNLVERAKNVSEGKVDSSEDNMLCIVNDGKKVALDPRLVGINADYDDSKLNSAIKNIYKEWEEGKNDKTTQLVFCDLGTPKNNTSATMTQEELLDTTNFNIYNDIKGKLMKYGVPGEEIEFIHNANTSKKRNELFRKFKTGQIRILIGSTSKMGEGCNLQDRLIALHELDCPWRPSDIQQREGRILRQGNMNPIVRIYRYCTKGTFDAYTWQTVETKAKFINQIMTGTSTARSIEDIDEKTMSYAEMKAASSDNPLILEKVKTDNELQRLQTLQAGFQRNKYNAKYSIKSEESSIYSLTKQIESVQHDIILRNQNPVDIFSIVIDGKTYTRHINEEGIEVTGRKSAGAAIIAIANNMLGNVGENSIKTIGKYRGFDLDIQRIPTYEGITFAIKIKGSMIYNTDVTDSEVGTIQRIENELNSLDELLQRLQTKLDISKRNLSQYKEEINKKFDYDDRIAELLKKQIEINTKLNVDYSDATAVGEE